MSASQVYNVCGNVAVSPGYCVVIRCADLQTTGLLLGYSYFFLSPILPGEDHELKLLRSGNLPLQPQKLFFLLLFFFVHLPECTNFQDCVFCVYYWSIWDPSCMSPQNGLLGNIPVHMSCWPLEVKCFPCSTFALWNDWVKLVYISGSIAIIAFVMLSLGNDAGCWICVLDHVSMGRIWLVGLHIKALTRNGCFSWFAGSKCSSWQKKPVLMWWSLAANNKRGGGQERKRNCCVSVLKQLIPWHLSVK